MLILQKLRSQETTPAWQIVQAYRSVEATGRAPLLSDLGLLQCGVCRFLLSGIVLDEPIIGRGERPCEPGFTVWSCGFRLLEGFEISQGQTSPEPRPRGLS